MPRKFKLFLIVAISSLLLEVVFLFAQKTLAQGGSECDQAADCEKIENGDPGPISWNAPEGCLINSIVIKAGQGYFPNPDNGCYSSSGQGTQQGAAQRIGQESPSCQAISFSEFWFKCPPPPPPPPPCPPCLTPTPTPTPTIVPTPTPTPTLEPTPTPVELTPTPTPPPGNGGVGGPPPGGGPPGPAGPPVCGAQTPPAPYLKTLTVLGGGGVELVWDPVAEATHYNISYGPSSGNYLYGVANTGKVTSFRVGGLGTGTYCFALRAVNDCAPSGLSNERCPGAVLGVAKVLGVTTLGATGSFSDQLFQILFIIGSVCLSAGLKLLYPAKKLARF